MTRRAFKSIRNFAKAADDFLMHFAHAPKGESTPDPAKAAAKQVGDAMHVACAGFEGGGGDGFSGTSATEELFGQVLADGHKRSSERAGPPRAV